MSGAAIVIEIAATDAGSPYTAALLDACSRSAHADMPCALPNDQDPAPPPMVALVTWGGTDHRAVEVQVGARRVSGPEWSTRRLTFAETDAEIERWRAVGLVIATLAGEVAGPHVDEPAPTPPAPPPEKRQPPPPARPHPKPSTALGRAWTLQAGAETIRGASPSFGAYGLAIGVTRRLSPRWLVLTGSGGYDRQHISGDTPLDLDWSWLKLGVGAELPLAGPHLTLETRLEPAVTLVHASLASGTSSQRGTLISLHEGLAITWWFAEWVGVSVNAELFESHRNVVVRAQAEGQPQREVARVSPVGWSAGLGLRLGFGTR